MDLDSFVAITTEEDDFDYNDSSNTFTDDPNEFSLGNLDITSSEDINFDEIDADLKRFQEDDMVQKSLSRGVDLRQYARETERDLRALTQDSIQDYMDQINEVAILNDEIDICDKTLERMQQMLQTFQSRLGGISDDIKHLQDDSLSMNIKLKNRRAVEARLQTFLEGIVVPPALVVGICESDVNESYVEALQMLNDKLKYASSGEDKPQKLMAHNDTVDVLVRTNGTNGNHAKDAKDGQGETKGNGTDRNGKNGKNGNEETFTLGVAARDTNAAQEVLPLLEMMRSKAVSKVRDFLLSRITSLRKGKTNVQMTQQMLLKFRYLFYFLKMHAPNVAEEIKSMYVSAMSKVLLALFKAYHQQLGKLTVRLDDKKSVFATVPPRSATNNNESKASNTKKNKPTVGNPILGVFEIGTRHEILDELENPPIVMHIAQKEGRKYLYEHIFRSVQKHLCDSAANDFTFLVDFFHARSHSLFNDIYAKTLALCLEHVEHYLATTMDSIAVLILIRINQHLRTIMQRRCCPCLDPYLDRMDLLLWPRLKVILDKNVISLETAPNKLGPLEFHVHFVTQRYAHFSSAVALLHREGEQFGGMTDANFIVKVRSLRSHVLDVLKKLSSLHQNEKARTIFLINNYYYVNEVFIEKNIQTEDREQFSSMLDSQKSSFVELELKESFDRLLIFVPEIESAIEESDIQTVVNGMETGRVESLVRHFGSTWKAGISHMAKSINTYFQNIKNGMSILKQCLTQLLLYNTRFQDIIRKLYEGKSIPFSKELVPIQTVLYEIKKYSQ